MTIENLDVSYGSQVIFSDFSATFTDKKTTVILGPSGCGKTTLLNALSNKIGAGGVSFIFQEPRLLPWHTLEKNIVLVLENLGLHKTECHQRARDYLHQVGLANRAGDYPERLSGGERQRAAIARAFSYPADILLMDEPFQSQDHALKTQLIDTVRTLQQKEQRTVIAVTHDIREATLLADYAMILSKRPARIIWESPVTADMETRITEILACQKSSW